MGSEFLFMDDNAVLTPSNIVDECLQSEDITRMDWATYSPDMKSIEHVWVMLDKRRITARQPLSPVYRNFGGHKLDEWCNIPKIRLIIYASQHASRSPFPSTPFNTQTSSTTCTVVPSQINVECHRLAKVVFSDESRFVLRTDDNRLWMCRRPGDGTISPHSVLRHCPHSWCNSLGAIAYVSRSISIMMHGTLTGKRNVDDTSSTPCRTFINGLAGAIFQQDNARPHTARGVQDFLRHFQTHPWTGPCSR
ncbi:transposable element Tcb1 transposase [Trichonephila clavipes]|nr:transposable element Tcb1 transposase [Trichonephila clavipes]